MVIIKQIQAGQRSQKPLEPQLRVCVLCQSTYKFDNAVSFEQGLIQDRDFCAKCFNEFMNVEYEPSITSHFW
jgi:hypothetical protein